MLVHSKAPPTRTTPLPFPFPFSPSPSLPSLTHRQLISRLRDLPFFLTLYSLTLPAFFRLQPHSFGCPRRSFWHSFTLVVPCSQTSPDFSRRSISSLTRHSLSKSTLNSLNLLTAFQRSLVFTTFFFAFIIIIFYSLLFPAWVFFILKKKHCLSDSFEFPRLRPARSSPRSLAI